MYPEELIKAFGKGMGLELEPDDSGSCTFAADSFSITLTALPELECIALTADLGDPPPEKPEALYRMMLEANHLFHATNGATLSVNGENGHIALCSIFPSISADAKSFTAAVERFANTCEAWSGIIEKYRSRAEDLPEEPAPDLPQGVHFLRV